MSYLADDLLAALVEDYGPTDVDGETGDKWCHYCKSMARKHEAWCPWEKARVYLAGADPETALDR